MRKNVFSTVLNCLATRGLLGKWRHCMVHPRCGVCGVAPRLKAVSRLFMRTNAAFSQVKHQLTQNVLRDYCHFKHIWLLSANLFGQISHVRALITPIAHTQQNWHHGKCLGLIIHPCHAHKQQIQSCLIVHPPPCIDFIFTKYYYCL